jgi:hypothetical protein
MEVPEGQRARSYNPNPNLISETFRSETAPLETVETYPLCSEISINQSIFGLHLSNTVRFKGISPKC